ncbi:MAG: IS607 family transposase [Okeania sp. SIO3B5]|uniref:IS607 family transposase n=1 Tax=Okeania sp. SIO3B5 TaxID=2607811 RepID=UPI0013FF9BBE|nr:IS607 family transposase [Okeania sp. SIO3B5]NEO55507.1 IS607 family transposase [Okeania sp. SIO3B5]
MVKNYVTPGEAARILGVCDRTLRYWEEQGKIKTIRTAGGQRRYDITTYTTGTTGHRVIILYARVSSTKQKEDLERQCEYLKSQYPDGELVKEVGGGLNYKRKKMLAILERVMSGNVQSIVVTYKDRLLRFGFDLLEWFCAHHNVQIVVLNKVELSPEREMVEDILSILHGFSARLYGLRKYSSQISKDQDLPRKKSPSNLEKVASSK